MSNFVKELREVINKHSRENGSNTPDFILSGFIEDCLNAFDCAVKQRESWYGRKNTGISELVQQPITGDKSKPEGDITPDCNTCRIRRSICPHTCSSEGCRSIYVPLYTIDR